MIKIFVTGGTFDKEYNELNGELLFNSFYKYFRCSPLYTKDMSNIDSLSGIQNSICPSDFAAISLFLLALCH